MNFLEYFEISATLGIKRLISLLAHSFAPRSHVVGVKHLRSWNVCQHRTFHSLEIKVFTAIITRYRLEYFFELLCAEPSLELIKHTNWIYNKKVDKYDIIGDRKRTNKKCLQRIQNTPENINSQ